MPSLVDAISALLDDFESVTGGKGDGVDKQQVNCEAEAGGVKGGGAVDTACVPAKQTKAAISTATMATATASSSQRPCTDDGQKTAASTINKDGTPYQTKTSSSSSTMTSETPPKVTKSATKIQTATRVSTPTKTDSLPKAKSPAKPETPPKKASPAKPKTPCKSPPSPSPSASKKRKQRDDRDADDDGEDDDAGCDPWTASEKLALFHLIFDKGRAAMTTADYQRACTDMHGKKNLRSLKDQVVRGLRPKIAKCIEAGHI